MKIRRRTSTHRFAATCLLAATPWLHMNGVEAHSVAEQPCVGRPAADGSTVLSGRAEMAGLKAPFQLRRSPSGDLRLHIGAPLSVTLGRDDGRAWTATATGRRRNLSLAQRDAFRFTFAILEGTAFEAGGDFHMQPDPEDATSWQVTAEGSPMTVAVGTDPATGLPLDIRLPLGVMTIRLKLSDYQTLDGWAVPRRVVLSGVGSDLLLEVNNSLQFSGSIQDAEPGHGVTLEGRFDVRGALDLMTTDWDSAALAASGFLEHTANAQPEPLVRWDTTLPADVEARRLPSGHLLVQPLVGGEDVGWFLLDSGASGVILDASLPESMGLEAIGSSSGKGAAGSFALDWWSGRSLSLGPLSFEASVLASTDLSQLSRGLGQPLAGILGTELFEGRSTRSVPVRGLRGSIPRRAGQLATFALGGEQFTDVATVFATDTSTSRADPYVDGLIGAGLLDRFELVFDLPHDRLGFRLR